MDKISRYLFEIKAYFVCIPDMVTVPRYAHHCPILLARINLNASMDK